MGNDERHYMVIGYHPRGGTDGDCVTECGIVFGISVQNITTSWIEKLAKSVLRKCRGAPPCGETPLVVPAHEDTK